VGLVLKGPRVVLRPALTDDVDRLLSILREPEVARRWGRVERTEVQDQFVGDAKVFVIEVDGDVVERSSSARRTTRCIAMRASTSS
jgi:hypothetical protein